MSDEPEDIQKEMEKTRSALTEKLEAIEGQVANTISSTTEVVQDTTQTVQETLTGTVEAVKGTVETVSEKVQETVQAVQETFDISLQMQKRPWVVMGTAFAAGFVIGAVLTPGSSRGSDEESSRETSSFSDYSSPSKESESDGEPGFWQDAFSHLRNLGLSYFLGMARDLVQRELPNGLGTRIADEFDHLTSKLGANPIQEPLVEKASAQSSETEDSPHRSDEWHDEKPTGSSRIKNLSGSKKSR